MGGNNVSTRGNEGTDRENDIGKRGDKRTRVRIKVYTADNFVGGGALVLLGLPLALLSGALPGPMVHTHDAIEDRAANPACAR